MAEVRIIVLTVDGHPSILVSGAVPVRAAFVDEMIRLCHGKQPGGAKHEWEIQPDEPSASPVPAAVAIALPASVKK
jgi:hypothetical protein